MKRVISIIAACVMVIGLVACGEKEVKNAGECKIEQNGVEIKMVFDAKGDKITTLHQTSEIDIEGFSKEDVEMLQETIDKAAEVYEDIDGVSYEIKQDDAEIIEKIDMNVGDKDTLKAVIDKGLLPVTGDNVTQLSLKETKKSLETAGWTMEK